MPNVMNQLRATSSNAYYYLLALLPGMVLATYYAGLTRKDVAILYKDPSALIKITIAIITALLVDLIITTIKRGSLLDMIKNPQGLLTGVLLALCLPNNLAWWETSSSVAFAIIVGHSLLNTALHATLVGYVFSLAAFPASHGLSTLLKSELYNSHVIGINIAFSAGGLFLIFIKKINWRAPFALLTVYCSFTLLLKITTINIPLLTLIPSLLTPTLCLGAFFIAPFIFDKKNNKACFINGTVIGIVLFLMSTYTHYPNALLLTLIIVNVANWAVVNRNMSFSHNHITTISSHALLIPILAASVVMPITLSIKHAIVIGLFVIVIYLSVQSISDVIKRYVPTSSFLSLVMVLTAFLSVYIGLSLRVYLPMLASTIDDSTPLLALSSLVLSYSGIFSGNQAAFKMVSALKVSVLFFVLVILMGCINQLTNVNRLFPAGLFFLFALVALYNNPKLSIIETPDSKPNRRVRTTGTIK